MKILLITLFILLFTAQADETDALFERGLTDQEKNVSENYYHQGLSNRKFQEECAKSSKDRRKCSGSEMKTNFMGVDGNAIKALAKAYTLVIGVAGGGIYGADGKEAGDDYCKYVAIGSEAIATFRQQSAGDDITNLPTGQDSKQKDLLYKASRSHGERAKIAKTQVVGWGITTGCYAGMMTYHGGFTSWQNWAKLGAAGLLTAFFQSESNTHTKYKNEVKDIAERLPGKGDCNPVTEKDCYCSQPETENDPTYCYPQMHKRAVKANTYRSSCIDDKMNADPQCACFAQNNCYGESFGKSITALNLGPGFQANVTNPLKDFSNGNISNGNVSASQLSQAAIARNSLRDLAEKLPDENLSLTKEQESESKFLQNYGIPKKIAQKFATASLPKGSQQNFAKFRKSLNKKSAINNKARKSKMLSFSGGSGLKDKAVKKKPDFMANFKKYGKKKKKNGNDKHILEFADEATQNAQISKKHDAAIFSLISRRYKKKWNGLKSN